MLSMPGLPGFTFFHPLDDVFTSCYTDPINGKEDCSMSRQFQTLMRVLCVNRIKINDKPYII